MWDCEGCGKEVGQRTLDNGSWYCDDCMNECTICGESNKENISHEFAIDYVHDEKELPLCEDCFNARYKQQIEGDYKNIER